MMEYCVYTLADSRKPDAVRYVGISSNPERRLREHCRASSLRADKSIKGKWISAVQSTGGNVALSIFVNGMSKLEACIVEQLIVFNMREAGIWLTNGTSGGDAGWVHSLQSIDAMRTKAKTRTHTAETKARIGAASRGIPQSPEQAARAAAARTIAGRAHTAETKARLSAMRAGVSLDDDHKAAIASRARLPEMKEARRMERASAAPTGKTGFKGVTQPPLLKGRFTAKYYLNGKCMFIGNFETAEAAAVARDDAAFAVFGPGCFLNFPERFADKIAA